VQKQIWNLNSELYVCRRLISIVLVSTAGMAGFGVLGAVLGGANVIRGGSRVVIGGWIAMGITYGIGRAFGGTAV
jgi:VIT1/CCC1 family predicted Fe2+/Mn2+ transporter